VFDIWGLGPHNSFIDLANETDNMTTLKTVEYQAGSYPGQTNDDLEVMLESTAELMSNVKIGTRVAIVNNDARMMTFDALCTMIHQINTEV
jgi:hypothetical protein